MSSKLLDLREEVIDFISRDFFVIVAIYSAKSRVGLKVLYRAQKLPLTFNLELALGYSSQKVAEMILRFKT